MTVVCGLDRLGLRIVMALLSLGEQVTVITDSATPGMLRELKGSGATVIEASPEDVAELPEVDLLSARCLLLIENADLGNLETALAAREVNPDLRVVMRMFSAELADRASRLLPNSSVLSASLEAAPYFADEALGMESRPTRHVWGRHLAIHTEPVEGHLLDLGGCFLVPIPSPHDHGGRRSPLLREFKRAARALFDLRLAITLGAFGALVATSALIFRAALNLNWVDAIYFTVTTATTTGYGDINLLTAPPWVKLYGSMFMLASAASLTLLFALVTDAIIGARILEALGVPRGGMRGHVVVVGLGNTGYRVVQHLLDAGVEVAAVEMSERNRFISVARRQGVPVLVADGRYRDSLRSLSIETARAVVALTDDDLANLEIALTARDLSPSARLVVRLFDPELAERVHHQLGLGACLSVPQLAMPAFLAAALGDGVLSTFEHDGKHWLLAELSVTEGSPADGIEVVTLEKDGGLHVLAVRDSGAERWRPVHPDRLAAEHAVLFAGTRDRWEHACSLSGW